MVITSLPCRARCQGRGFTLVELCIVLAIMALLASVTLPALETAFTEQTLRGDAHQFSMLVKTAMIKSQEQHRPYLLLLDGKSLLLEPAPSGSVVASSSGLAGTSPEAADAADADSDATQSLDLANVFKLPDAVKKNKWETVPSVRWTFRPASLCPLPRVRLEHGKAWIEMSFNALTGNVEDEAAYIP